MFAEKQIKSVDSTTVRDQEQQHTIVSTEKWKQLESKYLKYIALLKSKANKSKTKTDHNNKYNQLALCLKYKLQNKMMDAFKNIYFNKKIQYSIEKFNPNNQILKQSFFKCHKTILKTFTNQIKSIINKNLKRAFLTLKNVSKQNSLQLIDKPTSSSKLLFKNSNHTFAIQQLQKLQSSIIAFSQPVIYNELFQIKLQNCKLKQQIILIQDQILKLKQQLKSINQRMQCQLLKKSLALMQSEIDSQQKEQLIKQYQIQLQCRTSNNNKVLLFTLQDFQIQRQRLQRINQKLYKQFENTKQTFIQEIKYQDTVIQELKSQLGRTNIDLSKTHNELQSLRAYRFQNQYEKQCEKIKIIGFHSSPKLSMKGETQNHIILQILDYIDDILSKQQSNKTIYSNLSAASSSKLESIEQKLLFNMNTPAMNKIVRLNSLQKAFQQNVRVSQQDLHSFLDVFQGQQQHLSIDSKLYQQLQNKVLSLNQRIFHIRELILTLLQSIQIKNPPKDLIELVESIHDIFQFSQTQKQSFYGGKKTLLQRFFF